MNKRDQLEMIVGTIESLADISESHPDVFNEVVGDRELQQLENIASDLVSHAEIKIHGRGQEHAVIIQPKNTEPITPSLTLTGDKMPDW